MTPILRDLRLDRRNLGHLVSARLGIVARKFLAAISARGRLAIKRLRHLFRRNQRALMTIMARLATSLLAAGWFRRPAFDVKGIAGRRLRGIRRVLLELRLEVRDFGFELSHPLFQLVHLSEDDQQRHLGGRGDVSQSSIGIRILGISSMPGTLTKSRN